MAALSITATAVIPGGDSIQEVGNFGATVTAGQVVYKEAATGLFKLCDTDSATLEARIPYGIAVNGGNTGQRAVIHRNGDLTINAVMTAGLLYYASPTAGGISPVADITTGNRSVVVGFARSTTVLAVRLMDTGVVV